MNVLITGGSRGIGAAAVRAFSARGDRVAFFYEKEDEKAAAVAAETGRACRPLRRCGRGGGERRVRAASRHRSSHQQRRDRGLCAHQHHHTRTLAQAVCRQRRRRVLLHPRSPSPYAAAAVRLHPQRQLHVGADRRVVRGGVFGDEGRDPRSDQGAGAGAGAVRHPRERRRAGRHPDRYVRARRPQRYGGSAAADRPRAAGARRRTSRGRWSIWQTQRLSPDRFCLSTEASSSRNT